MKDYKSKSAIFLTKEDLKNIIQNYCSSEGYDINTSDISFDIGTEVTDNSELRISFLGCKINIER